MYKYFGDAFVFFYDLSVAKCVAARQWSSSDTIKYKFYENSVLGS